MSSIWEILNQLNIQLNYNTQVNVTCNIIWLHL